VMNFFQNGGYTGNNAFSRGEFSYDLLIR
jgi:hypothetical protein